MVIIGFDLWNRRFIHEIGPGFSRRLLIFDAAPEGLVEINVKGVGAVRSGMVRIHESDPVQEPGRMIYIPFCKNSDTGGMNPHRFQIETKIPPSTFQALLTHSLKDTDFCLSFTSVSEGSLSHGATPDGNTLEWDVEKEPSAHAESIKIAVYPKEKDDD